jgi:hypothetical protein
VRGVETLQAALAEQREMVEGLQASLTDSTAPLTVRLRRRLRASIGR